MTSAMTVVGNATRDPEIRYLPNGTGVANFSVAVNRRRKKGDEWEDETSFVDVTCWAELAENVAESVQKGTRVIVHGYLRQESWEKDGEKKSKLVLVGEAVGPDLRWATVDVVRAERRGA